MIANLLNVLLGLWLAYSAIFAQPAGDMNDTTLAASAAAVIVLAAWGRRSDFMGWNSGTNIVLGAILLVLAALRWGIAIAPLVSFWIILLAGIAVSIVALWSMLYRPGPSASAPSA